MKKYLVVGIVAFIIIVPIAGAFNQLSLEKNRINIQTSTILDEFTHTIFAEYGARTTCPHCPGSSNSLYSIY